jgi:hypothetical protein
VWLSRPLSVAPTATTLPVKATSFWDGPEAQPERERGRSDDSSKMENVGAAEKLSNTAGSIMDSRQVVRELRKLKSKLGTKGIGLKFTGMREIDGGAGGARLPALRKKHASSPNAPRERRREG